MEEIWTQVEGRAHQQSAGGTAADRQAPGRRQPFADQPLGAGDEVVKGVLLMRHPSGLVPPLSHLAAAAHMGNRESPAAIEKADHVAVELRLQAVAVGAVSVEQ